MRRLADLNKYIQVWCSVAYHVCSRIWKQERQALQLCSGFYSLLSAISVALLASVISKTVTYYSRRLKESPFFLHKWSNYGFQIKLFDLFWTWLQRGHQNSLEYLPMFFIFMTVGGIKHPIIAALLGCIYVVARYFYFIGYSTGDPKNRLTYG